MDFSQFPYVRDLGGDVIDLRRLIDPNDKKWGATNPSIGNHKNKYVVALRSSNYVILPNGTYHVTEGDIITSKIYWGELNKEFKIENLRQIDTSIAGPLRRGLEDPKVFYRDNAWHITCVIMDKERAPYARMAVARLDTKCTKFVSFEILAGMDTQRPEKNWMTTYELNPHFDYIYGPNAIVQSNMMTMLFTDIPRLSQLRGNTNLLQLEDGTYLGVCHRTFIRNEAQWAPERFSTQNAAIRNYVHYFAQYDYQGNILAVSKGFQFYKSGVEFAAGLVAHKDNFLISFGRDDVSSHIARLPKDVVLKSLIPLEY
jgi:hypothetical protein